MSGGLQPPKAEPISVLVMGAGSVGCYLGGILVAAGLRVDFVGRPRVLADLRAQGLTVSDLGGGHRHLPAAALRLHDELPAELKPDITLLCVKSGATAEAAQALQAKLPAASLVVSMQNGVGNAERARAAAPALAWRAGMTPFNIAELGAGHFHRGSLGALAMQGLGDEPALAALQRCFESQGLGLRLYADLQAVQWGKLLINLNNPVNAMSGQALRAELLQRGYRRCFAALQSEALDILEAAGIEVAAMTPLPPRRLITMLRLPTPVFRLLAARMLKIDAKARSSMADDLSLGRPTEIDALCGEVIRLAAQQGRQAPLNARMQALVQAWLPGQSPFYSPAELLAELGLA
ncbi:2-dehydropantoate 2-reductase [Roseateles oligotrophus]|uniref:2-dehydropantoate 2-reductase n=1 Tax=Roseateles oligotrophus TaxID=1769250 RepID=A0ABT2YIR9_9BURK|nr:2-dehydropantoate 2-reductase [Roseateles oligotrophus]MCV2369871.1 2-dehydropantoate 2-reductase [Roseateles oligotrophus]